MSDVNIQSVLTWVEDQVHAIVEKMNPIDPGVVGYDNKPRYWEWCRLKDRRDRFKTIRGHLRSIEADTKGVSS